MKKEIDDALQAAMASVRCETDKRYTKEELELLKAKLEKENDSKSLIYDLVKNYSNPDSDQEEKEKEGKGKSI